MRTHAWGNKTWNLTALLFLSLLQTLPAFLCLSYSKAQPSKTFSGIKNVPKHVGGKEAQQNEAKQCKPATTGNALTQGQSDSGTGTLLAVSAGP